MQKSELPDYTARMIDEYYKNNISLFLNALSDKCLLWLGPHEGQIMRSKAELLEAFAKETSQLSFRVQNLEVIPVPINATAMDVILVSTVITIFPGGESVAIQQRGELLWVEETVTDESGNSVKDYRVRVCHISNEHPHDKRDTIYPTHFVDLDVARFYVGKPDTDKFAFKGVGGSYFYLSSGTILWMVSKGRHTVIRTTSRVYECIESLSAVTEKYADVLCRVHACYSVNPAFVAEIGRFYVVMGDGERISIPEKKYTATRDALQRRMGALRG